MRSEPERRLRATTPRHWRRLAGLALIVAWGAGVGLAGPGVPAAEESRFLPWTEAPVLPLAGRDVTGQPQALADHRGQVVLVNFWATWCEFCKDEFASLKRLQEQLAGRSLAILLVNFGESPPKVRRYARQIPLNAHVVLDPDQEAARAWRVRVIPSSFLVDPQGRVRYRVIGTIDWGSEESLRAVRALLP